MFPSYWQDFLMENNLEQAEIEFPWPNEDDLTCDVELLSEGHAIQESTEYWPGIGVRKDGFIPVGNCSGGTGDPYFINTNDGKNGPLYKIDHERVSEEGYSRDDAVSIMLDNYSYLVKFANT